jgi:glycosyltransferase involved in cell wall biosynthesis
LPSSWPENAPLAALEAAMMGVPLICSERGGLPELLALGAAGKIVSNTSPSELNQAIRAVRGSKNSSPQEAENRLASFRDAVSWSTHLASVEGVYNAALAGGPRAGG